MFAVLPPDVKAQAGPGASARDFHNTREGQLVAGLVGDVLRSLGLDSTLRVFQPELVMDATQRLERTSLQAGFGFCHLTVDLTGVAAVQSFYSSPDVTCFPPC